MIRFIKIINIILAILLLFYLGFYVGKNYDIIWDSNHKLSIVKQSANQQKMKKLLNLIDQQYIKEVDSDSLIDATLNYVLQGLDPHSAYLNSAQNASMTDISGEYEGLGVEFYSLRDTLTIIRNLKGSPNSQHFLPGDKILKINGNTVVGEKSNSLSKIVSNYNSLELELLRNHHITTVHTRKNKVPLNSIESAYRIQNDIGYIRLSHFSKNAAKEFHSALESVLNLGAQKIILDLRDNGGGLLSEAKSIANEFLSEGEVILYLQNEKDQSKEYYKANNKGLFPKGEVYVIINENSASASEVVAGALQDNDRATILGRRSFGKGLVQREITLNDGSTFRITTARYYTPAGRSIQKDYNNTSDYNHELMDRYYSGEMYDEKKIKKIDSLKKVTPGGKIVYGGGGIIPDVYVPVEPYDFGDNFYSKDGGALIKDVVVEDIGENIPEYYGLNQREFITHFQPQRLYQKAFKTLTNNDVHLNEDGKNILKVYIKAYVAKILFGEDAYFRVWNTQDDMVQKTIEMAQK